MNNKKSDKKVKVRMHSQAVSAINIIFNKKGYEIEIPEEEIIKKYKKMEIIKGNKVCKEYKRKIIIKKRIGYDLKVNIKGKWIKFKIVTTMGKNKFGDYQFRLSKAQNKPRNYPVINPEAKEFDAYILIYWDTNIKALFLKYDNRLPKWYILVRDGKTFHKTDYKKHYYITDLTFANFLIKMGL